MTGDLADAAVDDQGVGDAPIGRRERKRLQTRAALIRAAMELFDQRGFDEVTVADIAERADVDPSTFFRHFGSKEAVLFTDFEDFLEHAQALISGQTAEGPILDVLRDGSVRLAVEQPFDGALALLRARLTATSPEMHAQDLVQSERLVGAVTLGVAHQLGVDPELDARPYLIASMWVGAFSWYRRRAMLEAEPVDDPVMTVDEAVAAIVGTAKLVLDQD